MTPNADVDHFILFLGKNTLALLYDTTKRFYL